MTHPTFVRVRRSARYVAALCVLWLTACATPVSKTQSQPESDAQPDTNQGYDNSREHFDRAPLPQTKLTGKDADADHIRDDVGQYIDAEFGGSELARLGARQLARSFQHGLVYADERDAAYEALHDTTAAIGCMFAHLDHDLASRIVDEIEARTVDTEERFEAYRKLQKQASGGYFPGGNDPASRCGFDTEGLAP